MPHIEHQSPELLVAKLYPFHIPIRIVQKFSCFRKLQLKVNTTIRNPPAPINMSCGIKQDHCKDSNFFCRILSGSTTLKKSFKRKKENFWGRGQCTFMSNAFCVQQSNIFRVYLGCANVPKE